MKVVIFLGKALQMGLRPEVLAGIIVEDISRKEGGELSLKELQEKINSPEWRKTVAKLEGIYTGKDGDYKVHPHLYYYMKDINPIDLYVNYEELMYALRAQIIHYFLRGSAEEKTPPILEKKPVQSQPAPAEQSAS